MIDYRFSDLAAKEVFLNERRDVWRVNPATLTARLKTHFGANSRQLRPHYLARISYNSANWQRPTKDAQSQEEEGTYNQEHGFGHEDWLFRNDWLIDGWRYGFVEGVNRSHSRLVEADEPFDLTLFTIDDQNRRRYVGKIKSVECLGDEQASWAFDEFKKRGWYRTMIEEIQAVGGDAAALGDTQWAKHVLNVRFRMENVRLFDPPVYAAKDDPVLSLNRYILSNADEVERKENDSWTGRHGRATALPARPYMRRATQAIECTPEHAKMQAKLLAELKAEFPTAKILCERDFIDISVQTDSEFILFEIKSDLEPKAVIRQALGQILEYAYHPTRDHNLPVRLVIVGRCDLAETDRAYLQRLKNEFRLPLSYRVASIS
jgi:hypothetical protein